MPLSISFEANHHSMTEAIEELTLIRDLYRDDDPDRQAFLSENDGSEPIVNESETSTADVDESGALDTKLDNAGLPHDLRINSAGLTLIKTGARAGCWKYKKGVDPTLITTVEAELRAIMDVPPPSTKIPPPPPSTKIPPPPPSTKIPPPPPVEVLYEYNGGEYTEQDLLDAEWGLEAIHALPKAANETVVEVTWPALATAVSDAISGGELTMIQVDQACSKHGVDEYQLLVARPDLVPVIYRELF